MKNKYWKQIPLEENIIWCKAIHKYAMEASATSVHTCQRSSQLTVASLFWSSTRPDDYRPIPKPFFQNTVIILLSQISFIAQFPEQSTSVLRLERTEDILYMILIKH